METARLNAGQFEAVHIFTGPALVLAGPGSGKTRVITERVRFLTEEKRVLPEQILVLTFSRAAASEMKQRYLQMIEKKDTGITFGTFHSVFYSILRELPEYRDLCVAGRNDQIESLRQAMTGKFGKNVYTNDMLNLILDDIGGIKNGLKGKLPETKELYVGYHNELRRKGLLDFDDMMLCAFREMVNNKELLKSLRARYSFLLVDEFQDINRIQYEIIRLLAYPDFNVFCVGDDDQCIYGFRGSVPAYMKKMPRDLPDTKILQLTVNYRSTKPIISVSEKLIRHNADRYQKQQESFCKKDASPVIAKFRTVKEETVYIVDKVSHLPEQATAAVLCRTNRALNDIRDLIPQVWKDRIAFHTFHTSKGLEFDCVFVAACNDEVTPGQRYTGDEELEEERRCFYVAATRARRMLYFLYTEYYRDKESAPSGFLLELL